GGWWLPRPEPEAPRLVFFHGNAGTREQRIHNLAGLWRAGISVLIFDYRGYGDSTGRPSEAGLISDGLTAFDWLASRGQGPIALFGRSLGGAVAAQVARRRPVAALVLESTFTSVPDMASKVLPFPGIRWLVHTRLNTLEAVKELEKPLLIIHGQSDELIPFVMGQTLYNGSISPQKQFFPVPNGQHNDTYLVAGEKYFQTLSGFLHNLPSR
ncbi:MAG: alpha/beta hydrolase, partial [Deltaproteobacteria bacterium]|nr:alpha/beta hydrolase [Deltaproteobacteria bacterium]